MRTLVMVVLVPALFGCVKAPVRPPVQPAPGPWVQLFNGRDLSNWDRWLGIPHRSVEGLSLPRKDDGAYAEPVGENRDPKDVFTVVTLEGEPVIRVSGEIYGVITTREEFDDFHLQAEYRWGQKRWPPREALVRDSGVFYYAVGPHGVNGSVKAWMRSVECQIQEHDTGDLVSVDGVLLDLTARRPSERARTLIFDPTGQPFTIPGPGIDRRVIKAFEHERNDWNLVEVICVRGSCAHVINGRVNMRASNPRQPTATGLVPLVRGKIQLQSEGAEVYFRNVRVRRATTLP